jgi:SAM-dependent methyltransferase
MVSAGTYEAIERLLPRGRLRCLDLGCDHYRFEFSEYEVHRCDINPCDLPNFKRVDLNGPWPYAGEEFDVIRACEVIEHLENPWHFFRECHRILKAGGLLVLSTPNIQCPLSRQLFLKDATLIWFDPPQVKGGHINPLPYWELALIAERTGFQVEEFTYNITDQSHRLYGEILILKIRRL